MSTDTWQDYSAAIASAPERGEIARVSERRARTFCEALLQAYGVPAADAALTADVFIQSDLQRRRFHGMRLLLYVAGIKLAGCAVAEMDGIGPWRPRFSTERSIGQVVAVRAMELAIAKAREYGVGLVGVRIQAPTRLRNTIR